MTKESAPTLSQTLGTSLVAGIADFGGTYPFTTAKLYSQSGMKFSHICKMAKTDPCVMYKGLTHYTFGMLPLSTIRVCLHSFFKKHIEDPSFVEDLGSSGLAGAISAFYSGPLELARTMALKKDMYIKKNEPVLFTATTPFKMAQELVKTKGAHKLFVGSIAAAARDGPYAMSMLTIAPEVQKYFQPYLGNSIANNLFSCLTTSLVTSTFNHPFDTIKAKQHFLLAENCLKGSNNSHGFFDAAQKIFYDCGWKGFFAGYGIRTAWFLVRLPLNTLIILEMSKLWTSMNEKTTHSNKVEDREIVHTSINQEEIVQSEPLNTYDVAIMGEDFTNLLHSLVSGY